jgi:hypothetical protein
MLAYTHPPVNPATYNLLTQYTPYVQSDSMSLPSSIWLWSIWPTNKLFSSDVIVIDPGWLSFSVTTDGTAIEHIYGSIDTITGLIKTS